MDNILDDLSHEPNTQRTYELASKNKRIANYFIDSFSYLIFSGFVGAILGVIAVAVGNDTIFEESNSMPAKLLEYVFGAIVIVIYYILQEYFFNGKTLGKLITKTRAVTERNEAMDFTTTLKRTLCRLIPFEAFSFLGDNKGWHDSISKTKVILDNGWQKDNRSDYV